VGDVFMSLIHTCQLCHVDPLDYLTTLHKHTEEVARNPQAWTVLEEDGLPVPEERFDTLLVAV